MRVRAISPWPGPRLQFTHLPDKSQNATVNSKVSESVGAVSGTVSRENSPPNTPLKKPIESAVGTSGLLASKTWEAYVGVYSSSQVANAVEHLCGVPHALPTPDPGQAPAAQPSTPTSNQ